jgi:hypothetical protein
MSGADALEHLNGDFPRLQNAVRDGVIKGRARGREKDRDFWVKQGLAWDDEYLDKVDDPWRAKFILSAPDSINLVEFGEGSELLREDVIKTFPKMAGREVPESQKPLMEREVQKFVSDYIKRETDAGLLPTKKGLEKAARDKKLIGRRNLLRVEFGRQREAMGCEVRRGRPRKPEK